MVSRFQIFSDKRERGVGQFLTLADRGGEKGVWKWTPPFSDDIICEQPLTYSFQLQCIDLEITFFCICWRLPRHVPKQLFLVLHGLH